MALTVYYRCIVTLLLLLYSMVQTRRLLITRATVQCTMHVVLVPPNVLNFCGLRVVLRIQRYLDDVLATRQQTVRPYPVEVETAGRTVTKYLKGFPRVSYDGLLRHRVGLDCWWTCCRVVSRVMYVISHTAHRNCMPTNIVQ